MPNGSNMDGFWLVGERVSVDVLLGSVDQGYVSIVRWIGCNANF